MKIYRIRGSKVSIHEMEEFTIKECFKEFFGKDPSFFELKRNELENISGEIKIKGLKAIWIWVEGHGYEYFIENPIYNNVEENLSMDNKDRYLVSFTYSECGDLQIDSEYFEFTETPTLNSIIDSIMQYLKSIKVYSCNLKVLSVTKFSNEEYKKFIEKE